MNTTKKSLTTGIIICLSIIFHPSYSSAQLVVPKGWENVDSVRFGLFNIPFSDTLANHFADSVGCNFEDNFGDISASQQFLGSRKGYMAQGQGLPIPRDWYVSGITFVTHQRVYYPSPTRLGFRYDNGYFWRYIDTNGYSWHNNRYDSNAINPYAEFLQNPSIDTQKFVTNRDTVRYGNEGRVILGYSDNRLADQMLYCYDRYPFGSRSSSTFPQPPDSARMFSAILEFNIDTESVTSIDTTLSGKSKDDVPLLRLQILFKRGGPNGMTILPFVPFKTPSDSTKVGWFSVVDTVITKKIYRSLDNSWRVPDTLTSGVPSHSWNFKQLHVLLDSMPKSMVDLVKTIPGNDPTLAPLGQIKVRQGTGSDSGRILGLQHPDSIMRVDSTFFPAGATHITQPLLEMRILSTYRATVRIRSLSYQDTVVDKFLYRKKFGDTAVHSCNPNGSFGGYDDSIKTLVKTWGDTLRAHAHGPRKPREILINDTPDEYSPLCSSMAGYMDYMFSKDTMAIHVREQEYDSIDWSYHYRVARMSHDGSPPSLFENHTIRQL
jgi:hypothetical protein